MDKVSISSCSILCLLLIDSTHRLRRKTIHPLLNLKYLSEYITFFDNYSNLCADALKENVDGPMFDFKPYIKQYSLNIFLGENCGVCVRLIKNILFILKL